MQQCSDGRGRGRAGISGRGHIVVPVPQQPSLDRQECRHPQSAGRVHSPRTDDDQRAARVRDRGLGERAASLHVRGAARRRRGRRGRRRAADGRRQDVRQGCRRDDAGRGGTRELEAGVARLRRQRP